ncbi:MAG: molybdopterin molybdotransferase MoeA [Methanotrichaceae archaeon]
MFKRLVGADEALKLLMERCGPVNRIESMALAESTGRVLAKDVASTADLPEFNRAAMDGFAVRSGDTRSASSLNPTYLDSFLSIRTGMAVPEGFDAVVMLEDSSLRGNILEVKAEVYPYRNVSRVGEDIRKGDTALLEEHKLRPPDIAFLSALGVESVSVYARPKVAIIPTGGELVAIGSRRLCPGEAYEINGLMAKQYIEKWGGIPALHEIVPDNPELIRSAVVSSSEMDMAIIIGGTSVGEKDYAPKVVDDLGELLVHGIRIQPGKPTALGIVGDKPVVCLPGYPVAALSALYLFIRPALKRLARLNDLQPKICARLSRKIASKVGYLSIVRVALVDNEAVPIMSTGAGILSSVAKADGFVTVPEEREGIEAGETVEVMLFE